MSTYHPDDTHDYPAGTGEPDDRTAWQADALAAPEVSRARHNSRREKHAV